MSHLHLLTREPGTALGWMDAGLLAKSFQDLISSAFSSCQTSSLLRTEGGFFTLVLLNCDTPRMLQRISQTGKIIHRCISCCRRRAATAQEGLVPGAAAELRLHLALAAAAPPVPLSMARAELWAGCPRSNHCSDLLTGITPG